MAAARTRTLCFALLFVLSAAQAQSQTELVPLLKALPKAPGRRAESSTHSGLPELYTLGIRELKKRTDVPLDKVFSLYSRDAQAGDAVAQASLARLYDNGVGVAEDKTQAVAWARKAAEQGSSSAQTSLASFLFHGEGTSVDQQAAYGWYRKAAEQGEPIGEFMVGWLELYGQGTRRDIADAQRWSVKAAKDGMERALAVLVATLPRDPGKRAPTYSKSKMPPLTWWSAKTLKDKPEFAEVLPLVLEAYKRDAEAGDPVAQYSLSQMYLTGAGVPRDDAQVLAWARKAADAGYALGALQVGMQYDAGAGVAKDLDEAYRWWRKAAEAGDPIGQYNLAVSLRDGRGVTQDRREAFEWLRKAAENDSPNAAAELSSWYDAGYGGMEKDPAAGLRWLQRAADLGDLQSDVYLGHRYASGIGGVGKDTKKAVELYEKAAVYLKPQREEELRKNMVQAQAAIREKSFMEAQQLLEKARNIAPWSEVAWYNLALVYAENGNFVGAMDDMRVFLALAPDSPQARGAQDLIYGWERKVKK